LDVGLDVGLDTGLDTGLDALAGAAFSPGRPAAAFAPPRPLADFDLGPDRVSDMHEYMTDWSVIVNWTEGRRLSRRRYSKSQPGVEHRS
jgi:hypothetical protein